MSTQNRPNIVSIGATLGTALAQLFIWAWNGIIAPQAAWPVLDAIAGGGVTTLFILAVQWFDRRSKRASHHVLTKHG